MSIHVWGILHKAGNSFSSPHLRLLWYEFQKGAIARLSQRLSVEQPDHMGAFLGNVILSSKNANKAPFWEMKGLLPLSEPIFHYYTEIPFYKVLSCPPSPWKWYEEWSGYQRSSVMCLGYLVSKGECWDPQSVLQWGFVVSYQIHLRSFPFLVRSDSKHPSFRSHQHLKTIAILALVQSLSKWDGKQFILWQWCDALIASSFM